MTLDEAIRHCEEVAEFSDRECMYERFYGEKEMKRKCAKEHRQLAGWLKLLKRILDLGNCNDCALQNSQCRYAPRLGEQVRYNCPFYSKEGDKNVDACTR
jgi:hypothetical protein